MTPTVSVLVPAFNCELTLERAVRSALDQPGVDVQVVIVDDASTDGTLEAAKSIMPLQYDPLGMKYTSVDSGIHPQLKLIHRNTNGRIAETLNTAAIVANGKYFIRLDTDDWYATQPGCLARMAAALDANPDVSFVYGARQYHGRRSDTYYPRPFNADDFNVHNAAGYCYMFRREIWDAGLRWKPLGTFGGKVIDLEDWQHLLAMIGMGHKGMALSDLLVLHYCFRWDGTWQELQDVQPEALAELKRRFDSVRAVSL